MRADGRGPGLGNTSRFSSGHRHTDRGARHAGPGNALAPPTEKGAMHGHGPCHLQGRGLRRARGHRQAGAGAGPARGTLGPSVQREALDPVTTCSAHSANEASGQAQAEGRGRPHPWWPLRAGNSPVTPQWPVLAGPPAARPASPLRQAPHAPRSPSCTTHPCKPGTRSPP